MHTILGIGTDKKHKGNKFNYVKKDKILVPITKIVQRKITLAMYITLKQKITHT